VLAHYFSERHDQISADAALAARGRGIHSILENRDQPTIGTPSESERDLLVDYIADVFLALLETRPEYTQVRLIGLKNGGKEIIRVNKNADGEVVRTPEIALQDKSGEPYFQEFVNHFQTGGDMFEESMSQVIYSRVTFNRENGRISYPLSFTLRAMHPVFDETKVPVGFVIINVDYNKLLSTAFSDISPDSRVIILNDQGDYLNYAGEAAVTSLEVAGEYTHSPSPLVRTLLESSETSGIYNDDEEVSYFKTVSVNPRQPQRTITIAYAQPKSKILGSVGGVEWQVVLSVALIIALSVILVVVLISMIMRPLKILEAEVKRALDGETALNLPIQWKNELGQLARAFQKLVDRHVHTETRLSLIIENIGEGIVAIDDTGTIVSFNPACERIFQYASEDVIGKNISMLMPLRQARHHDRHLERYRQDDRRRIDWSGRVEVGMKADGTEFPMELTVTELVFEGQPLFVGIVRDISERQQAEKAKSEFLANISHELRTPLTAIKGALGLMQTPAVRERSEKAEKITSLALRNCDRLQDLIEGLLDLERIEGRKFRLNRELLGFGELLEEVSPILEELREKFGVDFDIVEGDQQAKVLGDRTQLRRVLANLLSNAAKFSKKGDRILITIGKGRHKKVARLSIEDHGCGVPEHLRETIFEKFTWADSSDTRHSGGAGIGLAISKEIVSLHGGSLKYRPLEHGGSVFSRDYPEFCALAW